MTLFPERQEAVKVLYNAAAQLLDDVTEDTSSAGRELCRNRAYECVELAEKIAEMGPVMVRREKPVFVEVTNVPFSLGFVTDTPKSHTEVEDDDKA